jgi:hypothetical protein
MGKPEKEQQEKSGKVSTKTGKLSSGRHKLARVRWHIRRLEMKAKRWDRYREEGRHKQVRHKHVQRIVTTPKDTVDKEGNEVTEMVSRLKKVQVTRKRTWDATRIRGYLTEVLYPLRGRLEKAAR